jgi:hypothetical protein
VIINLKKLLLFFLCLFAFLAPLEYIVNVIYGENFLLKPYRIAAILIIVVGLISIFYKNKIKFGRDLFFHLAVIVGWLTTAIQFILREANGDVFFVIFFQFALYYLAYIFSVSESFTIEEIELLFYSVVAGSVVSLISMYIDFFINGLSGDRLGGFFQNVNTAGFTLSIAGVFLFYKGLNASANYFKSAFYYLFSFLFILGVFFTGSRTAFAIVFFGIIFLIFLSPLVVKLKITIIGLLIGLIFFDAFYNEIFLKSSLKTRIETTTSLADDPRADLNLISRSISRDNYFFGIGVGQYYIESPKYYHLVDNSIFFNRTKGLASHNTYYTVLVEWGLLGLVLFLLSIGFQLNLLIKRLFIDILSKLQLVVFLLMLIFNFTGDNLVSPIWWVAFIISTITVGKSQKMYN